MSTKLNIDRLNQTELPQPPPPPNGSGEGGFAPVAADSNPATQINLTMEPDLFPPKSTSLQDQMLLAPHDGDGGQKSPSVPERGLNFSSEVNNSTSIQFLSPRKSFRGPKKFEQFMLEQPKTNSKERQVHFFFNGTHQWRR